MAQDRRWFDTHKQPNPPPRYEGVFDEPNAQSEFDLIAFSAVPDLPAARPPLNLTGGGSSITAVYFIPPGNASSPAVVQAKLTSSAGNYLMQSMDADHVAGRWNRFTWPGSVIWQNHLETEARDNLAVVVTLGGSGQDSTIAPALIYTEPPPTGEIHRYEFVLRLNSRTVESLSYQVTVGPKSEPPCYYTASRPCAPAPPAARPIEAGTLLRLPLDLPKNAAAARAKVDVKVRFVNNKKLVNKDDLTITYLFYHQPEYRPGF